MPIAIVGSGRSGTSMITGMLGRCGLYIGEADDQIESDERNPRGYWEHRQMRELTDRVLGSLASRFGGLTFAPEGWQQDPSLEPLYEEARRLVERCFAGRPIWGWKYPQTSLVIPFWRTVVPDLRFIVCMRNPLDAISSLKASFSYTQSHAGERWMLHLLKAFLDTRPEERFVTFYERYFPDYHGELFALLDFVGLPRPAKGTNIDRALADFHHAGLNHYQSSIEELMASEQTTYLMRELYLEVLAADRHASQLPILSQADIYMPLLAKLYAAEEKDHQLHHLQTVLNSRTHRMASAICSALVGIRTKVRSVNLAGSGANPVLQDKKPSPAGLSRGEVIASLAQTIMLEKRTAQFHWSKNGQTGGGRAELSLSGQPCEIDINIDPVQDARLWLDISPAPSLLEIHAVAVLGAHQQPLQNLCDPGDIRALTPGTSSWWTAAEGARLLSLGERNILYIDLPETSPPAHAIRLKLSLIEPAGATSLSQAMGELLNEASREHEGFAKKIESLLAWQRDQITVRQKPANWQEKWIEKLRRASS